MKHAKVSRAWRPVPAATRGARQRRPQGVASALLFNLSLVVLAISTAFAVLIVGRDHLYAYEYSPAGARVIAERVERLNGGLIQLDFDRQRQWEDLVGMELLANDVPAARGFLLSAPGMLPDRLGGDVARAAQRGDAEAEAAALELLSPSTRSRYESLVPLLSRRSTSGVAENRPEQISNTTLGGQSDFELMARSALADPDTDPVQFILTGFGLGLAGSMNQRDLDGAVALLAASHREDYSRAFGAQIAQLLANSVNIERFRNVALAGGDGDTAAAYANSSAAFRVAVNAPAAARVHAMLAQIGDMAHAISTPAATNLVMHAEALRDLPRLRLIAQAAGDRAAAAAKRLPHDGRLLATAGGQLTVNRDLAGALTIAAAALFVLLLLVAWRVYRGVRRYLMHLDEDDHSAELVDISASNWRPL